MSRTKTLAQGQTTLRCSYCHAINNHHVSVSPTKFAESMYQGGVYESEIAKANHRRTGHGCQHVGCGSPNYELKHHAGTHIAKTKDAVAA